ncbi:MAG: hypothetical protein IJ697_06150 [Synergistaceae bacterium]|nr:hypothetical protein [Synergistaceae bacterium]
MEELAERSYMEFSDTESDEVSDEENDEILRAIENLTEDDLKIARSEIIFV